MKSFLLFVLAIISFSAQADQTRDGTWIGIFQRRTLQNDYAIHTEAQFRYNNDDGAMGQTLFRVGLLRKLSDKHEVGLIMGFIQSGLMKEYRPTFQHIYQAGTLGNMKFTTRERLEYRNLEDNHDDSMRLRLQLRGQQKLTENFDLVVWDEPFLNLTDDTWTGNRTIERNRLFIGGRIPITDVNVEVGYLNQFTPRAKDLAEHILVLYFFY